MLTWFKIMGVLGLGVVALLDLNNWSPFSNKPTSQQALSGSTRTGPGSSGTFRHK
jgi:hypothetical protein